MKLPAVLKSRNDELERVFDTIAVPVEWPEGRQYDNCPQAEAIGRILIKALGAVHAHLAGAKIAYLFREEIKDGDRQIGGKASRAGAKLAFLADVDFVMELNWTAWRGLNPQQRIALVDHELCHFIYDAEAGKYQTRGHDVEEFGEIIERWGFWTQNLRDFHKVSGQTELFEVRMTLLETLPVTPVPA